LVRGTSALLQPKMRVGCSGFRQKSCITSALLQL